jgi:hypothetical protein
VSFEWRPVPKGPPKFDLKSITKDLRVAMEKEGKEHRRLLKKTTKSWKGEKPDFETTVSISPPVLKSDTVPTGPEHGVSKWWWLERGTSIRWAVMSRGWRSKTRRAILSSGKGRGRVVIAGKRAMRKRGIAPRPGIKARNWRAEVVRLRFRKYKGELKRVFDLNAKNMITPKSLRNK